MLRVGHIDAIPPIGVDGEIHDISRFGQHLAGPKHLKQRGSDPLGDVRPSLLTHNFSDLAAYGKALEIGQGKRRRSGHHSIDDKSPIRKTAALQAFEGFVQGRDLVSERNLRNHAARKLTSERVSGQKPLDGVGQRFTRPIDSTTIRWDESVALGQIGGDGQSRNACGCGKAGGHKLAT